jgi:very-short-patch-repair endonuclease
MYIVDFYCAAHRLVIELDGDSHAERIEYDEQRTEYLRLLGCRVLRFANSDVFENLDGVLSEIEQWINQRPSPQPSPRVQGEGESLA